MATDSIQALRERSRLDARHALLLFDSDSHCHGDCQRTHRALSIITRFWCSAGYLLITAHRAVLWVDGRYHLAASRRLNGGNIDVRLYTTEDDWLRSLATALADGAAVTERGAVTEGAAVTERAALADGAVVTEGAPPDSVNRSAAGGDPSATGGADPSVADSGDPPVGLYVDSATTPYHSYMRRRRALAPHGVELSLFDGDLHAVVTDVALSAAAATSTAEATPAEPVPTAGGALPVTEVIPTAEPSPVAEPAPVAEVPPPDAARSSVWLLDAVVGDNDRERRLNLLRRRVAARQLQYFTHNGADDINWLLNIRGGDIDYNQIALCYLLLTPDALRLYLRIATTPQLVTEVLVAHGITVVPYEHYYRDLRALPDGIVIGVPQRRIRCKTAELLRDKRMTTVDVDLPSERYIKTASELSRIRMAMVSEGVAMVQLLIWIGDRLADGARLTEADVYAAHIECRARDRAFLGQSFSAIIAYQQNAAQIHYNLSPHSATEIAADGVLLIDCGGHYLHGTTDITRVYACGTVSDRQRFDYTMVLRAHIALATAQFPYGATGSAVDLFARMELWRNGCDYRHGTGHGVGFCLNVHDGPYTLSPFGERLAIERDMIFSNEPGIYYADNYGIRLESLVRIVDADQRSFLTCETLSLCPFDRALVDTASLSAPQKRWINDYHRRVARALTPHLEPSARRWLAAQTAPL